MIQTRHPKIKTTTLLLIAVVSCFSSASELSPELRFLGSQNSQEIRDFTELKNSSGKMIYITRNEISTESMNLQLPEITLTSIDCEEKLCFLGTTDKTVLVLKDGNSEDSWNDDEDLTLSLVEFQPLLDIEREHVVLVRVIKNTAFLLQGFDGKDGIFRWDFNDVNHYSRYVPSTNGELVDYVPLFDSPFFLGSYKGQNSLNMLDVTQMNSKGQISLQDRKSGEISLISFLSNSYLANTQAKELSLFSAKNLPDTSIVKSITFEQDILGFAAYKESNYFVVRTSSQVQFFNIFEEDKIIQILSMPLDTTEKYKLMKFMPSIGQIVVSSDSFSAKAITIAYQTGYQAPACATSPEPKFAFTNFDCSQCAEGAVMKGKICSFSAENTITQFYGGKLSQNTVFGGKIVKNVKGFWELNYFSILAIVLSSASALFCIVMCYYGIKTKRASDNDSSSDEVVINQSMEASEKKTKENPQTVEQILNLGLTPFENILDSDSLPNIGFGMFLSEEMKQNKKYPQIIEILVQKMTPEKEVEKTSEEVQVTPEKIEKELSTSGSLDNSSDTKI